MEENEKIKEIYLDTNFFVYLFTKEPEELKTIFNNLNKFKVFTSCLTYDEFVWAIRKAFNKEASIKAIEFFLSLDFIRFLDLNKSIINKSAELIPKFNLKPRDSLHLATMNLKQINEIVSDDPDFGDLEGVTRISIFEFIKKLENGEKNKQKI